MDVKSCWRKAIKEDRVEKIRHSLKYDDSITGRLTPLEEPRDVLLSPDPSLPSVSCNITPPVCHQGTLHKSTLSWDTFNAEVPDNSSGTGSSVVHFSLDQETLPELPSCDSLLSLDDEAEDLKSEEELFIPSLTTKANQSPLITHHHLGQIDFLDGFSMDDRNKTPILCKQWPKEPVMPVEALDKVFSLDLDALGTHTTPEKQEYSLPNLITFSPIDDRKH